MKAFFEGLALVICILALVYFGVSNHSSGYDKGQLDLLKQLMGGAKKVQTYIGNDVTLFGYDFLFTQSDTK